MNNSDEYIESIYNMEEAFKRGNLFPELYTPYKNYRPRDVKALDEKSRLLLEIDKYSFVAHEMNLYLDIHPNNSDMLQLFNKFRNKVNELTNQYENKYGPLTINSNSLEANPFLWETTLFPFEGGANNVGL